MVLVIGVDVHKKTHTVVVVDATGRKRGERTEKATDAGHLALLKWVKRTFEGDQWRWAIEDCRQMSIRLERALLAVGESVVRVPTKMMCRTPGRPRGPGGSPTRSTRWRWPAPPSPNRTCRSRPMMRLSRELKLLVDRREDLVGERTRMINRFRWHLHELDPEQEPHLDRARDRRELAGWLADRTGLVAEIAAAELADIERLTAAAKVLEQRITTAPGRSPRSCSRCPAAAH
jgi:transposase